MKKYIIIAIILIAVGFFLSKGGFRKYKVDSMEQMYDKVVELFEKGESNVKFTTTFDPSGFNVDSLMIYLQKKDPYLATNIGATTWSWNSKGDGTYTFVLDLGYNASKRELDLADKRIDKIVECMEGLSDYEKIKAAHDFLILYCEYGTDGMAFSSVMQGPYWTLYPGMAVCNGYAMSFYRIMEKCGIQVRYETGGDHAWNSVFLNGYWYNIDVTWDDRGDDQVSYDFFLKCDKDFGKHHHGHSDAPYSYVLPAESNIQVKSAQEYYDMFPNFKARYKLMLLMKFLLIPAVIVIVFVIRAFVSGHRQNKWQEMQRKQREIDERNMARVRDIRMRGISNSSLVGDDLEDWEATRREQEKMFEISMKKGLIEKEEREMKETETETAQMDMGETETVHVPEGERYDAADKW